MEALETADQKYDFLISLGYCPAMSTWEYPLEQVFQKECDQVNKKFDQIDSDEPDWTDRRNQVIRDVHYAVSLTGVSHAAQQKYARLKHSIMKTVG